MTYKVTLNRIRAHSPCESGWVKLLAHLAKTTADNKPLSLLTVLESNGLDDTLWCLCAVNGHEKEIRRFACDCALDVIHLWDAPPIVKKYLETGDEKLRDAAWDAAWGAAVVGTGMIGDTEKVKKAGMIWLPFVDALEAGLFLYFVMKDKIICCPRPCMSIVDNRLHNPKGPAVFWPSGEKYFFLSGVKVPEELVMTPAEKLDPKMLFAEKNAEVRREIVRKIGMERIILKCGATTLDKDGDYELLEFDIGDNRKRPYLKMRNPSIATWHIEGVAPGTKTVEEALHFRKPVKMASLPVDDENGENWYQQGDVVVWSHTAKSLKRCPLVLT